MFWKIIQWGGTAILILTLIAAFVVGGDDKDTKAEVKPTAPASSFNL